MRDSRSGDARGATTVLIVGCRKQILEVCSGLDLYTVVAAGPWEQDERTQLLELADDVLRVDDPTQPDTILAALARQGYAHTVFDAVVPASDEYVLACVFLSQAVTRAPTNPWTALSWRFKDLQKRTVGAAGIPVARSQFVSDVRKTPTGLELRFPVVVKPNAAAGASHLRVARSPEELASAMALAAQRTPKRNYLLEEFVVGTEYQLDAVVEQGVLTFLSVSRCIVSPLQSLEAGFSTVYTVDEDQEPELYRAARELVQRSASALSVGSNVLHLEAFRDGDGDFVFGECGVRLGGVFNPELVKAKYGFDLAVVYLELLVGRTPSLVPAKVPEVCCRIFLPTREGVLRESISAEELLTLPGVQTAEIQALPGAVLPPPNKNAVTRVGEAVIVGADLAQVEKHIEHVMAAYLERLVVEPEAD